MRKIIHIDMDAFFAAVEMRDNPKLRNVPMAVGGSSDKRGVISTSNYLARKFGVKSAMPTAIAMKLCPELVLVRGKMEKYKEASEIVFNIFREYTDIIEGLSWDEAYLDVSESNLFQNSATKIATDIRQKILKKTNGLTASAGIAPNKLLAKIASDFNKPNGQFTISPDQVDNFIKSIPVTKIHGVGKVTADYMFKLGVKTCLDLQKFNHDELSYYFGKFGNSLYDYCRGIDDRQVQPSYERKSLGTEETFSKDLNEFEKMTESLVRMIQEIKDSLNSYQDRKIKNLFVKIKYFDFKQTTIERQLPFNEENFINLFTQRWLEDPRPVRLIGVGVKFETHPKISHMPLFDGLVTLG